MTGAKVERGIPFLWHMARVCLELPHGSMRHIPAGSYYDQMATQTGQIEMELMRLVHASWHTFKYMKKGEWHDAQTSYFDWLREPPPPEPPTRFMDALIAHFWNMSEWTLTLLESLRSYA